MVKEFDSLSVRPFQIMCIICRMGSDGSDAYCFEKRLDEILARTRKAPRRPLTLRCNVDSLYAYQNPGRAYDTPEGRLFNEKRDLDIIQRLGMVPGATRPAREIFFRVFKEIPTCAGICGYDHAASEVWRGCNLAHSGNYERGHAEGLDAIIAPRSEEEMARVKKESCAAMYKAEVLQIRPHHLLCMSCFHGGKEELGPIDEDNLFEAIDIIQRKPETPIELIAGPCMICPPCPSYDTKANLCISGSGMSLRDQKKDLDTLQLLGMSYGDMLPARELFRRLFKRIHSTRQVCVYKDGILRAPEWRICGEPEGREVYIKARAAGLGVDGVKPD